MTDAVVIDANPMLSALLGGQARDVHVHVLALALEMDLPICSEDRDFEGLPNVTVHKTADLLALIAR